MVTDIAVKGVVKAFEEGINVLDGLSFDVLEGEHIGIVGVNGSGKTTVFRMLVGELSPDEGEISVSQGKRVGLISQIPVYPAGYTVEDVLKSAHRRVYELRSQMEALEKRMEADSSAAILNAYDRLSGEFERLGGYELKRFRDTVANGLRIPQSQREQLFDSLSGGEKTRVNLGRLILEDTDILLLDEPTNHLDLKATEWLEDYLLKFKGTVIAISHDRYFLDRVVSRIVEFKNGKAAFYSGNYTFYVEERERRYLEQLKRYEKEQAEIKRLQASADKLHLWAFMGNDKLHKRAFSMEKRIEKLSADRPDSEKKIKARFGEKRFQGDEVLILKRISKGFGEKVLFQDIDLAVRPGERIGVVGDNGTGKTTLLNILLNREKPDSGLVKIGPAVKPAYLQQVIHFDHPERSILDTLVYGENYSPQTARNRLGAFRFSGDDVFKRVSQLSGGEQSRLSLCILMKEDINLLLLDEPTNHLDIQSREWIEEAVEEYGEALIFVSHDRYFINCFATRIWEVGSGTIRDFRGTFEEYQAYKERLAESEKGSTEPQKAAEPKPKPEKKKRGKIPPEKTIAKLEKEIEKLEAQLAAFSAEEEKYASDYVKLMELGQEKQQIQTELDEKYAEWERLQEEIT